MVSKNYYSNITYKQFKKIADPDDVMSQTQLANFLDVSQGTISLWKKKNKIPRVAEIIARGKV